MALIYLGLDPDMQEGVFEEMESIFHGTDRLPTLTDLNEMKYLDRIIKETLRLYPSATAIGRVVSEDIQVGKLLKHF